MPRIFTVIMCAMGALALSNQALAQTQVQSTEFALPGSAVVNHCAPAGHGASEVNQFTTTVGVSKFNPSLGELDQVIIEYVPVESTFFWDASWDGCAAGAEFYVQGEVCAVGISEFGCRNNDALKPRYEGPDPVCFGCGGGSCAGQLEIEMPESEVTITGDLERFIGIGMINFAVTLDVRASIWLDSGCGNAGIDGFFNGFIYVTYIYTSA